MNRITNYNSICYICTVAPLVGAWIETESESSQAAKPLVAPLVGAWIETKAFGVEMPQAMSRPSWARGLKR